jgi:hypothetical protein
LGAAGKAPDATAGSRLSAATDAVAEASPGRPAEADESAGDVEAADRAVSSADEPSCGLAARRQPPAAIVKTNATTPSMTAIRVLMSVLSKKWVPGIPVPSVPCPILDARRA